MKGLCFRGRGMAAWLGGAVMLALGPASAARAESEPCRCIASNQSVVSEVPCLIFRAAVSCEVSSVRNACEQAVTLVDWPLTRCPDSVCSLELLPREEARFVFDGEVFEQEGFFEQTYAVRVAGAEQQLTVSAEVTCRDIQPPAKEGCAAAPGPLAAGAALLAGAVSRRRRRRGGA